jgi:hypothetical protein
MVECDEIAAISCNNNTNQTRVTIIVYGEYITAPSLTGAGRKKVISE